MNAPSPLDLVYSEINALGGYVNEKDPVEIARDELLGEVLAILERHGARDADLRPLTNAADYQAGFISCGGY